jgi:hypothetical protein
LGSKTVGCFIVQGGKRVSGNFSQLGLISFRSSEIKPESCS